MFVTAPVDDPFSGSGTTGQVALRHGRDYIGIDLDKDCLKIAKQRIESEYLSGLHERLGSDLVE